VGAETFPGALLWVIRTRYMGRARRGLRRMETTTGAQDRIFALTGIARAYTTTDP